MSDINQPIAFCELLKRCRWIEVPLIQRDYAQGRQTQKDVRDDFLTALHDDGLSLPIGDQRLPLNLDFVYGSVEGEDDAARFLPLDGQQRLTTLFLLHWYLAWRDEALIEFRETLSDGRHSRFTYGVLPSSTEFFDALVDFVPACLPDEVPTVKRLLEDQPWFFLHWRSDPTIQAVLTMLDAIHERFKKTTGLYSRLVDERQPVITFHLLPLEHFGLSDDLYIKMNARGKPLTAFEAFKARFEEHLKTLFPTETRQIDEIDWAVPQFFERRMDTRWTDFFWSYRDKNLSFDDAVMNLIWALLRVSLDPASPTFSKDTTVLGEKSLSAGYTAFNDHGWLSRQFAEHLMDVLDTWSIEGGKLTPRLLTDRYFDEAAFFKRAITAPAALTYPELVQFAAFVFYLTHHHGTFEKPAFQEWMRVIANLVSNTDIERPEEFARSLTGLQKLVPHSDRVLEYLAGAESEQLGFSPQQLREEALKAKLILSHPGWRELIDAAEAHGYFNGQVEFLLKFSGILDRWLSDKAVAWTAGEHEKFQRAFSDYFAKAAAVFSANGLIDFGDFRWERALLMKGDYLLPRGINRCLLDNRERDASWKRLLRGSFKPEPAVEQKRGHVHELLDDIDLSQGVKESLDSVLMQPLPAESWRCAMIEQPAVIGYCWGRKIRWHGDGNIYLLRRTQMNGEHAELFTFHLKVGLLTKKHENGELAPFGAPQYWSVNGEADDPCAYIAWSYGGSTISLRIVSRRDSYGFRLSNQIGQIPAGLHDAFLSQARFNSLENGSLYRTVDRTSVESALNDVVNVARQTVAREAVSGG
jgi:hypothetical protein